MSPNMVFHDLSVADIDEREGKWELAMSQDYIGVSVQADPGTVRPGSNYLTRQDFDDLRLVDMATTACSVDRSGRAMEQENDDNIALVFITSGCESVIVNGTTSVLTPGDAVLWDPSQNSRFQVPESVHKRNLIIPRLLLRTVIGPSPIQGMVPRSPALRVLMNLLGDVSEILPDMVPKELSSTRNAVLELLAGTLHPDRYSSPRVSLRTQIDRWIQKHLDADLTPAVVAAEHSISVRTLNRIYSSSDTSISVYIRNLRLARSRQDLLGSNEPIAVIAYRWHFSDPSHFGRRFLEHFGETPSDVRRQAREQAEESISTEPLHLL